jgi:uncharacterized protein
MLGPITDPIERALVYRAPPRTRGNWKSRWVNHEDAWFESRVTPSAAPVKLHGWFCPHPKPRRVVLYAHGATEHVADLVSVVVRIQDTLDASVLVFDYRGYGRSEGTPSEDGCIADGLAAQQWLAERTGVLPEDLVLVGRSLGGAVMTAVAIERGARTLVVENTFSRLVDVAAYHYPWLLLRPFMRNTYDSISRIQKYAGPFVQLHGTRDRVVPAKFARELYSACPSHRKRFYTVRGGGHFDPTPLAFYGMLDGFLTEVDNAASSLRVNVLDPDSLTALEA